MLPPDELNSPASHLPPSTDDQSPVLVTLPPPDLTSPTSHLPPPTSSPSVSRRKNDPLDEDYEHAEEDDDEEEEDDVGVEHPDNPLTLNAPEDWSKVKWQRGPLLGVGGFGEVYMGLKEGGGLFAVKQIKIKPGTDQTFLNVSFLPISFPPPFPQNTPFYQWSPPIASFQHWEGDRGNERTSS